VLALRWELLELVVGEKRRAGSRGVAVLERGGGERPRKA